MAPDPGPEEGPEDRSERALGRLVDAIRAGDLAHVKAALDGGVSANTMHHMGGIGSDAEPVLVTAAKKGNVDVVTLLLMHGADMKQRGWRSRQSMFHDDTTYEDPTENAIEGAISYGRIEVVKLLLDHGASASDALGCALSKPDIARLLLERGASPNGEHLGASIVRGSLKEGNLAAVKLLLEFGADPNQPGWGKKRVILNALEYGRLEEARALLAAGATPATRAEVEQAMKDAWLRHERDFRERALLTAWELGFDVEEPRT